MKTSLEKQEDRKKRKLKKMSAFLNLTDNYNKIQVLKEESNNMDEKISKGGQNDQPNSEEPSCKRQKVSPPLHSNPVSSNPLQELPNLMQNNPQYLSMYERTQLPLQIPFQTFSAAVGQAHLTRNFQAQVNQMLHVPSQSQLLNALLVNSIVQQNLISAANQAHLNFIAQCYNMQLAQGISPQFAHPLWHSPFKYCYPHILHIARFGNRPYFTTGNLNTNFTSPLNSNTELSQNVSQPYRSKPELETSTASQSECTERVQLTEEELKDLRKRLRERKNLISGNPYLRLKEVGEEAQLKTPAEVRVPLFFADLQHLIMFSLLAQNSPSLPQRWCQLSKCGHITSTTCLLIEGLGLSDYLLHSESLVSLSEEHFPFRLEVVMPAAYKGDLIEELTAIPLSVNQRNTLVSTYGSLEAALKASGEIFRVLRAIFPVKDEVKDTVAQSTSDSKISQLVKDRGNAKRNVKCDLPPSDKFPRTHLLLSVWQMIEESYPMPINAFYMDKYKDFVMTKDLYTEVTQNSPMYGLDCEMCITAAGQSELTRVSIVNESLETVYDTLVLPPNRITNYLTHYSGITPEMMRDVRTTLQDVHKFIRENIEPDAIFVGQSLNFDLIAMKMMHPYCIDTSVVFNMSGDRYRKSKLKYLAEAFLGEKIQYGKAGHCSIEDSTTSLRLVQLKLANSIEFGDAVLGNLKTGVLPASDANSAESGEKEKKEDSTNYSTSLFSYISRMKKDSSIVGKPEIIEKYMDYLNPRITSYATSDSCASLNGKTIGDTDTPKEEGQVECSITMSHSKTASVAAKKAPSSNFTIAHIRFSDEEAAEIADGQNKLIKRINKWVSKLYESAIQSKSLTMVVLCGREKSSNGVCFLKLHRTNTKLLSS